MGGVTAIPREPKPFPQNNCLCESAKGSLRKAFLSFVRRFLQPDPSNRYWFKNYSGATLSDRAATSIREY
jgi:hypothetical protein